MVSSIRKLCESSGYPLNETIYEHSPKEMMDFQIVCGDFFTWKTTENNKRALVYKDSPIVTDFSRLCKMVPEFEGLDYGIRDEMPYFSSNMDLVAKGIADGRRLGVEGGPCLFGTDEVAVEVVQNDGQRTFFDYNTGKTYLEGSLSDGADLAEYISAHAEKIAAIHFEKKKPDLTPQEWAFIKYPFEIARVLAADLVVTIPDMSYAKYLESILLVLPQRVRLAAMDEFRFVSHAISDMYLDVINRMRSIYRSVRCEVLHERDEELCRRFYDARAPYIERNRVIRKLTRYAERVEPVKDYVSMPALPFYLFDATTCIEINSMDETDSYRKCAFAHKGADVDFACVLYPELLSRDKVHTIFEASQAMKEYGKYVVQ